MQRNEAVQKFCPLYVIAYATIGNGEIGCCCDAEACMLWRWKNKEENDGYCGLAGREDEEPPRNS